MDKSLKKLSRLELLELMVRLSEDRDVLIDENEQLRYALAAKPNVPRAAKVGSIAELAMQTNGVFDAAQRAADDYLREIKRMRDQLASRMAAEGVAPAQENPEVARSIASQVPRVPVQQVYDAAIQDAQNQARAIVQRANVQADAIVANARAKSEEILADANRQSRAIVSQANRQADAVISAARSDAARSRDAQAAAKIGAQAGAQAGAKAAAKTSAKTGAKAGAKAAAKTGAKTGAKAAAKTGAKTGAKAAAKSSTAKRAPAVASPALSAPIRGRHVRAVAE